jgi:hypothetical protein
VGQLGSSTGLTFDHWWKTIGFKIRNKAKQAEKKGVVIREVPFSDSLIRSDAPFTTKPRSARMAFLALGKDFDTELRINANFPDRSIFIGALFEGNLIRFATHRLGAGSGRSYAHLFHDSSLA